MAVGEFGSSQIKDRYGLSGSEFATVNDPVVTGVAERFGKHLRGSIFSDIIVAGNGLTVERDKVTVYSELAKVLFKNLFGSEIADPADPAVGSSVAANRLGTFLELWIALEKAIALRAEAMQLSTEDRRTTPLDLARRLFDRGDFTKDDMSTLDMLRMLRNEVVHGRSDLSGLEDEAIAELKKLLSTIQRRWGMESNPPRRGQG